jgi:oligopeptide/dipeptide ABC transporter ATP-binding protein
MTRNVLEISGLCVNYYEQGRTVRAVDAVDVTVAEGSVTAVVGESGCGKTTLGLALLNLVPHPGRIDAGQVWLDGTDVLTLDGDRLRAVRGRQISMIFQDAVSGLNPVMPVGAQVQEIIETHLSVKKKEARRVAFDALARQGLEPVERIAASFPFQLSGGMCQRVMIAIATVLRPRLIIADEPTAALDVTVQASILRELDGLRHSLGVSIILITHDLGVVAQFADDVAVMYAGRIVERGTTSEVYARPRHPYTSGLLAARPRLDAPGGRLASIPGSPPDLGELTGECAFLPRCGKAVTACRVDAWPELRAVNGDHAAACYNPMYHGA